MNIETVPKYKCHKEVRAFEIGKIEGKSIYPKDDSFEPIEVTHEFMTKHPLNEVGYIVVYADGYVSYSPKKAFEEGYTLMP
jgi:hypothetical protein